MYVLDVAVRQYYLLHRNTQIIPLNSPHTRPFTWTQNLLKKKDTGKQTADQGVDTNEVVSRNKTTDRAEKDEPPTPVIKIIAPEINTNKSKDKIVLDNVLEQSLDNKKVESPKPAITEPIKKLKEKIIGIKAETEQEGFC